MRTPRISKLPSTAKTMMNKYATSIAAVATPPGKGGVAIIRISGTDSLEIASKMFLPISKKSFKEATPRMQIRGNIVYEGEEIDDGMATYFKAPASYTGEDTVEIACHGGMLVTKTVLEAVFASGAVPAEPGEFTRRAFINGKLSLIEAEAIGNLLEAESREQIKLSSQRSRGILSKRIAAIRALLTSVLSSIYARIDYPDEELGDFTDDELCGLLNDSRGLVIELIKTYRTGKAVSEGIKTVICGKPNVGKSTLYNLLVGEDAAIVTDIEGTTRDVLTDKISLGRVILNLSDTAGVRDSDELDPVEKIGIERSLERIESAELLLCVFDGSKELSDEDRALISEISRSDGVKIAVINKADIEGKIEPANLNDVFDSVISVSAKSEKEETLAKLGELVNLFFTDEKLTLGYDAVISSARQNASLSRTLMHIESARDALNLGITQDAVSSDIERALGAIAELDGRAVSEEVVADIFSKFCVGK